MRVYQVVKTMPLRKNTPTIARRAVAATASVRRCIRLPRLVSVVARPGPAPPLVGLIAGADEPDVHRHAHPRGGGVQRCVDNVWRVDRHVAGAVVGPLPASAEPFGRPRQVVADYPAVMRPVGDGM